jgi:hypothetical protein
LFQSAGLPGARAEHFREQPLPLSPLAAAFGVVLGAADAATSALFQPAASSVPDAARLTSPHPLYSGLLSVD